jgi:adenylate cyclase
MKSPLVNTSKSFAVKRFRALSDRSALVAAAGALLVGLLLAAPAAREWCARLDAGLQDQMLRSAGGPAEREDLVFLGIDEASLKMDVGADLIAGDETLVRMARRFPWDRRVYAAAIDRLLDAGARLVVIDLVMAEGSDPEADAALAEMIARHRGRVVLASAFAPMASGDDGFTLSEPLPEFLGDGPDWTRSGYVNFRPHSDGLVRDSVFTTTLSEENGSPARDDEPVFRSLAAEVIDALGAPVPDGRRGLRFVTRDGGMAHMVYEPIPFREIFLPDEWTHRYGGGGFFRDKVVMIGPAAPRFQDQHRTPAGLLMGPQLHLQAITCGLENAFVRRPLENSRSGALWLALAGVLMAWAVAVWVKRPLAAWLGALALVAAVTVLAFSAAAATGVLVGFSAWAMTFVAGVASGQSHALVVSRFERGRLHREFRRFVSRDVADALVEDQEIYQMAAAGRKRRVVVLFSDIRGFTNRSERERPEHLVGQLNEYFSAMVETVFRHSGTLDKFIGDAVMAHWGALDDADDATHARNALATAREMVERLNALNAKWAGEGREVYRIGVGIHLGEAVAGEIGSAERTEFAVIGDAVNLASRIEGLTKLLGADILVSGAVVEASGSADGWRRLARMRVKGRDGAVEVWGDSLGPEGDAAYAAALAKFESGDFTGAAAACDPLVADFPADGPARALRRWAHERLESSPATWDGVVVMERK